MAKNFRENLRNELKYQNLTIKELSARSGIPVATLDCYLGNRATVPSVNAAYKIAKVLKVSMEYLVCGENPQTVGSSKKKISQETIKIIKWVESLNTDQCKSLYNTITVLKR